MKSADLAVWEAVPFIHGVVPVPGEGGAEGFLLPCAFGQDSLPCCRCCCPERQSQQRALAQAVLNWWICQCQLQNQQKTRANQDCSFPGQPQPLPPAWKPAQGSFFPQDLEEASVSRRKPPDPRHVLPLPSHSRSSAHSTAVPRGYRRSHGTFSRGGTSSSSEQGLALTPAVSGTSLTRQGLENFTLGLECPNSTAALAPGTPALLGQGPSVLSSEHKAQNHHLSSAPGLPVRNMKYSMALMFLFLT